MAKQEILLRIEVAARRYHEARAVFHSHTSARSPDSLAIELSEAIDAVLLAARELAECSLDEPIPYSVLAEAGEVAKLVETRTVYEPCGSCGAYAGHERDCPVTAPNHPDAQCPEHGCARWRCQESH